MNLKKNTHTQKSKIHCLKNWYFPSLMHFRKRNGVPLVIDDHRMDGGNVNSIGLKIQQVLRSDLGNYTCELHNEYGVGVSDNAISLDVHCK